MSDQEKAAWDAGFKAGMTYERSLWHWSAGDLSRRINGLKVRPTWPKNPFEEESTDERAAP